MYLNVGIISTLFHEFGLTGEIQHVVPLGVIRYWNRNCVHEISVARNIIYPSET